MPRCHYCGTHQVAAKSNCPNCGAGLPAFATPATYAKALGIVGLLMWLVVSQFASAPDVSIQWQDATAEKILYRDAGVLDRFKSKIIVVKLVQETGRSLILDVEYNFVATDAGRSQIFALPDMPYWSHTVAYAQPGHNTANVVVDLNVEKMQAEGVRSVTSSRLSTSIARYSETAYLGEIGTRHIPFHKRWFF